jgi:hypothetical protein
MYEIGVLKIFPNGEKYENSARTHARTHTHTHTRTHTQDLPLCTLHCAIYTTEIGDEKGTQSLGV